MVLALLALLVGAGSGLIGAAFRLSLEYADRSRDFLIVWARGQGLVGFLLVTGGCAVTVAAAAWLVRRFSPHASGSGIPHVEACVGNVRFGSKADIGLASIDVRFTPKSGHRLTEFECPLCATSGRRATRVYCDSANVGFRASRPICGGRAFIIKGGLRLVPFDFVLPGTGKS
jgi:hypothetical protein